MIKRVLISIVMIFLLLTIVFVTLRILPGDPAVALLPAEAPPEAIEAYKKELGLDKPLYIQFFEYMSGALCGSLGRSWYSYRVVIHEVLWALPTTIELAICAMIVGVLLGLTLGIISSMTRDKLPDHLIRVITMVWYSIPVFWLGPTLQLIFGIYLGVLPTHGRVDLFLAPRRITGLLILDSILTGDVLALLSTLHHLILPMMTLGIYISATFTRISRGEIINVLQKDYILTARAKGLTEWAITRKHALPNALLPVLTIMGMQFAALLGGLIVTETIFNLPGMGSLLIMALAARDFPLMQGVLIFSAFWVGVITLLIDITYSLFDPRIKR